MSKNNRSFLLSMIKLLEAADLPVWIFGGWAEEFWQITPPRTHNDIDFLYPATTFEMLDHFIAQTKDIREIQAKQFSHKRALVYDQVMIEFLLVQHANEIYFTNFFSGQYHLEWPNDVFCHTIHIAGYDIQIAGKQALIIYRQYHQRIQQAYMARDQQASRQVGRQTIIAP